MKILENLSKLSAILAGLLMTAITLLTCVSIIGRETLGKTVPGDFELVGLATGAAVGLFMPLCQLQHGNIIVDFFTARVPHRVNRQLDRLGALLLGLCFVLLAWRAGLGGLNSWQTNSSTMLLGVPEWYAYVTMVPGFLLTAVIALHQAVFGFRVEPESPA
ncbi:TRAP transporter small permease [Polaromonas sp. CT11-55]|uniref:TRAP transporter small permease n=1 Tax=Polaromonas sp. CT11-55 TaxID=3243045 RepID=UPI0039A407D9